MRQENTESKITSSVDELLTVQELAEKLKTRESWVYGKSREKGPGAIPAVRCGKYVRFRLPDVLIWLEHRYGGK